MKPPFPKQRCTFHGQTRNCLHSGAVGGGDLGCAPAAEDSCLPEVGVQETAVRIDP